MAGKPWKLFSIFIRKAVRALAPILLHEIFGEKPPVASRVEHCIEPFMVQSSFLDEVLGEVFEGRPQTDGSRL
jgi:hypothetical protein